jgi:DNA-binding MltR family transcriptional regulator
MAKRSLFPVEVLSKDTQSFYDVLNNESDLGVVLVAASYIDASLGALLQRFLMESSVATKLLDVKSGPLGSLAPRADACYCLGLVDKWLYQDLLIIAEIRNQFAHHHLALSFAVPEVAQQCEKLAYVANLKNGNTNKPLLEPERLQHPRDKFVHTLVLISQRLLLTGLGAKRVQGQV